MTHAQSYGTSNKLIFLASLKDLVVAGVALTVSGQKSRENSQQIKESNFDFFYYKQHMMMWVFIFTILFQSVIVRAGRKEPKVISKNNNLEKLEMPERLHCLGILKGCSFTIT